MFYHPKLLSSLIDHVLMFCRKDLTGQRLQSESGFIVLINKQQAVRNRQAIYLDTEEVCRNLTLPIIVVVSKIILGN
jgi:hypothetical protein